MRILDLALKDLSQILRDKGSLLFLVAMPIVFTLFMGFAYKSGEDDAPADNRFPLGWVNNDPGGTLSQQLYTTLSNSDSVKLVELQPEVVDESVRKGEVAGVLVIPQGFSASPNGSPLPLTLVADPVSATGQSLFQLLRTPVTQLFSSVEIARLSAETAGVPEDTAEWNAAFAAAAQAWSGADSASLVKVEMAESQEEDEEGWFGDNPYNQASPGILVQFAIMGMVTSGQILVQERKSRTLQRMMTTTLRPWQIIAGHILAMFALVFLQEALLVVFGQLALGVNYARQPLGVLLVSVAMGLWIAAMGLLISVLAKDDSQVVLFSLIAMFILSGLGGTWFPLEASSGAFAAIGGLMPSAWAMNGYQNILIRGLGLASVWMPVMILMAYALGFFVLAVWRFRRMEI
jgi:ABC-2 type transport system permease protein